MWEQVKRTFQESADRQLRAIVDLLPGLLAMLLVLLASALLAVFVRLLVRRVCDRLDVDRRLRDWGMVAPAAEGRGSPSLLVARLSTWAVLVLGLLVGVRAFDATAASALAARLLEYLPHAVVGFLALGAGLAASRAIERSVLIGAVNMGLQSARLLGLGARWLVLILAVAVALEQLGFGGAILTVFFGILFGGIVLALVLAVGLGAKDVVARSLEKRYPVEHGEREPKEEERELHHL